MAEYVYYVQIQVPAGYYVDDIGFPERDLDKAREYLRFWRDRDILSKYRLVKRSNEVIIP